tara:strand:+ start:3012 stop:3410 length:399 start_codon:yes stop_codon:yes gene_type:complete
MKNRKSQSSNATRQNPTGATRQNPTCDIMRNDNSRVQRSPDGSPSKQEKNATSKTSKKHMSVKQSPFSSFSSVGKEAPGEEAHQTAMFATYIALLCCLSLLLLSLLGCASQKAYIEPDEFKTFEPQNIIHIT